MICILWAFAHHLSMSKDHCMVNPERGFCGNVELSRYCIYHDAHYARDRKKILSLSFLWKNGTPLSSKFYISKFPNIQPRWIHYDHVKHYYDYANRWTVSLFSTNAKIVTFSKHVTWCLTRVNLLNAYESK